MICKLIDKKLSYIAERPRCGMGKLWQKCEKSVHLTSLFYTAQNIFRNAETFSHAFWAVFREIFGAVFGRFLGDCCAGFA